MHEQASTMTLVTVPEELFWEMVDSIKDLKNWLNSQKRQDDDGLLTVAQTTEFFGCSRATLNNWKKKKVLIPKVIEGRVYYLKADCLKALQGSPSPKKGGKRNG